MAKLEAEAIGRNHTFVVCNSPAEADELGADTFDSSQATLTIMLDKKVAAEIAKLIDKSIYEPHKSLAEAIKHFAK